MYFQAEAKGIKYDIEVKEQRYLWEVSIREEEGEWVHHKLSKTDYLEDIDRTISFLFGNASYLVDTVGEGVEYNVYTRGSYRVIQLYNDEKLLHESLKSGGGFGNEKSLSTGMPGKILKVLVEKGQEIKTDEPLLIMEAMKMENEMRATHDVKIKDVHVKPGQTVEAGEVLISYE